MATHSKLSPPLRAVVALVVLACWACSSSRASEAGDGSDRHLDGAQAGAMAVAGGDGVSEATGGARHQPDGQNTGDTGSVGVQAPDRSEDGDGDSNGQGGSPPEPDAATAGAAGETAGVSEPPAPSEAFLRGEVLVTENQCVTCHQRNFAGFTVFSNITPDLETGIGAWTDAQIVAAIRQGVAADGGSLCATMQRYPFSDEQAADVVAFLRGVSAVSNRITSVCPGHVD